MGRKHGTLHQYKGRRKRKRSKPSSAPTPVSTESNENATAANDISTFNGDDTTSEFETELETSDFAAPTTSSEPQQETDGRYSIVSLEAINRLLEHVKCGSCGAGDVKIVKEKRMYGLVAKLTLYCEICEDVATEWSSPRVNGTAKARSFDVNVRAERAKDKLSMWQSELHNVFNALDVAHSKKASTTQSARRRAKRTQNKINPSPH